MDLMEIEDGIARECDRVATESIMAAKKYGDFTSTHEAFGVLAEEVAELLLAIHENKITRVEREARQVAAVALRLAEICGRPGALRSEQFKRRSGF